MKRIDIYYGGEHYSIGGSDFEEVKDAIARAADGDRSSWFEVNDGEAAARLAHLLIARGVPIAIVPVPEPTDALDPAVEPR